MDTLTDFNSRRVKDSTVIVLNRFSNKLVGFLSIETDIDHFRFTDQKEFLWIIPEVQAVEMKKVISEEEEFFVFTKNKATDPELDQLNALVKGKLERRKLAVPKSGLLISIMKIRTI